VLQLSGVSKRFGGLRAVDRVGFDLGQVPVTGLVGPNGSGKTTLFHLISGFYTPDQGRIAFQGRPIQGLAPHRISRLGLVRTFQHSRILPCLTVRQNLMAAAPGQSGERLVRLLASPSRIRREEAGIQQQAGGILDRLQLAPLAEEPAQSLSYGQQKLLELGRVMMTKPKLILLDEPTAGVNPTLIRQLVGLVTELQASGIRILLVEHNMPLVTELCHRLLVMDAGRIIFDGPPGQALKDEGVIEAYLGKVGHAA
jgi:ABC-type branched-subunit amino acid transport system ATPase component